MLWMFKLQSLSQYKEMKQHVLSRPSLEVQTTLRKSNFYPVYTLSFEIYVLKNLQSLLSYPQSLLSSMTFSK